MIDWKLNVKPSVHLTPLTDEQIALLQREVQRGKGEVVRNVTLVLFHLSVLAKKRRHVPGIGRSKTMWSCVFHPTVTQKSRWNLSRLGLWRYAHVHYTSSLSVKSHGLLRRLLHLLFVSAETAKETTVRMTSRGLMFEHQMQGPSSSSQGHSARGASGGAGGASGGAGGASGGAGGATGGAGDGVLGVVKVCTSYLHFPRIRH